MPDEETTSASLQQEKLTFKNKLILLALFGALLGFVIKTEAAKRFTIGFEDYKLPAPEKTYDINQLEKDLLKKREVLLQQQVEAENAEKEEASCEDGNSETCKP